MSNTSSPRVGIIMGSQSDWPTMKLAAEILDELMTLIVAGFDNGCNLS